MVRKNNIYICIIILICTFSYHTVLSQQTSDNYKYRIQFKDKKNSPYSINNPSEYLSAKALNRRNIQNIKIQTEDLPVNPAYIDSIQKKGVRILNKSRWLNYVTIENADSASLNKIKSYQFVSKIETVYKPLIKSNNKLLLPEKNINADLSAKFNLNNKKYCSSLTDIYKYGYSFDQVNMISCDSLHSMGYRGKDVTIAVLDAGFRHADSLPVFDSLRYNNRISGTKDFVNPGGNVYNQSTHGMMVLSTMAGNIPGYYIGTAPEANYWLLRTEDANSEYIIEEDNWVSAAEFADSAGADIINSSLGYTRFMDSSQDHTYKDLDGKTTRISIAATIAARKGIIVVNSAGNEGGDKSWGYHISVPADADSIISVGAVDMRGKYADFSSRGPTYDDRIKPDVSCLGVGAAVANYNGDIISGNGTSFSSPIVAGMVACLVQSKPIISNIKIIDAIKKSCSHYIYPDNYTGYGIPNAIWAYSILSGKPLNIKNISIYPNPTINNVINISILLSKDTDIITQIYDITGKEVYNKTLTDQNKGYNIITIHNTAFLSKGIYYIRINAGDQIYVKKLIKLG